MTSDHSDDYIIVIKSLQINDYIDNNFKLLSLM